MFWFYQVIELFWAWLTCRKESAQTFFLSLSLLSMRGPADTINTVWIFPATANDSVHQAALCDACKWALALSEANKAALARESALQIEVWREREREEGFCEVFSALKKYTTMLELIYHTHT